MYPGIPSKVMAGVTRANKQGKPVLEPVGSIPCSTGGGTARAKGRGLTMPREVMECNVPSDGV